MQASFFYIQALNKILISNHSKVKVTTFLLALVRETIINSSIFNGKLNSWTEVPFKERNTKNIANFAHGTTS